MELMAHGKSIYTSPLKDTLTQGEANVDGAVIVLPCQYNDIDLTTLTYVIKAVNSKNNLVEQTLHKTVSATDIRLDWVITGDYTTASGEIKLELIGVDSTNTTIIKYSCDSIFVAGTLTGTYAPPKDTLEKALLDVHIEVGKAMGHADNAKLSETASANSAIKAKSSEDIASQKAVEATDSATKAKASENNAKVSETNSKTSETKSSQALSDLLKMIGVDIATLVGGKIPVEQIPSIATTEIYQANSLATMNLLVVQNGDICIRTDENKSYIYNNGWVHLSSPTDYASRAGHAETATTAENATMINNHRMAEMSQADFVVAVKDPNTYYLVK